jgi:hypothetical protein
MRNGRFLALVLLCGSALGCGQDATTTGPVQEPSFAAVGGLGSLAAFAFGDVKETQFGIVNEYSFVATRSRDGDVEGRFRWTGSWDGETFHGTGRVTCLTVIDNLALLTGVFEETNATYPADRQHVVWAVEDNGNKRKSPPDRASLLHPSISAGQAEFYCSTLGLLMTPVEEGEVVVWTRKTHSDNDGDDGGDE